MSALAVMPVRNEAGYLETTLRTLIDDGLEVTIVDNGSLDGSLELAERFLGGGVVAIRDVPWQGRFEWAQLLHAMDAEYAAARHDWLVHVDADEWLRPRHGGPLGPFLEREVGPRYVAVDFREFVFLPPIGRDMWGEDYRRIATRYYLYEKRPRRLVRAWRRGSSASISASGGHRPSGVAPDAVLPEAQVLRHYIGLSWSHLICRRADRSWAPEEVARGWHGNRQDLTAARPVVQHRAVRVADPWDATDLDDSAPSGLHVWEQGF